MSAMAVPSHHLFLVASLTIIVLMVEGVSLDLLANKINGGSYVDISQVPWMVAVMLDDSFCGGSIISKDWVLTAAHCTNGANPSSITVRVGSSSYNYSGYKYRVDYEVKHPDYDNKTHVNDITLLRTLPPISLVGPVSVVKLPTAQPQEILPTTMLTVTGWGYTGVPESPPLLKMAEIVVVDFAVCTATFENFAVEAIHLCTDRVDGIECMGDSGGPLMMDDLLVGFVSLGDAICGKGPSISIKVSAYRMWIQKVTGV